MNIFVILSILQTLLCLVAPCIGLDDFGFYCTDRSNHKNAALYCSNEYNLKSEDVFDCFNVTKSEAARIIKEEEVVEFEIRCQLIQEELSRVLSNLPSLRILHLENNQIEYIGCESLSFLSKPFTTLLVSLREVKELDIRCIIDQLSVTSDVQESITSNNELVEIHYNGNSLRNLESIRAKSHQMANLGEIMKILRVTSFNDLNLSGSTPTELDFTPLRYMTSLKRLDIPYSRFEIVKYPSLLQSVGLEAFHARGNQIQNAIQIIHHINSSIQELYLSDCFIGEVNNTTFDKLTNLRALRLANTQLSILDSNPFGELKELLLLDISFNNLSDLNFNEFSSTLKRLWEFEAKSCQLRNAIDLFGYFGSSLTRLDLSNNFIGSINATIFNNLPDLSELYLANTNLLILNSNPFGKLLSLQRLDISYNNLKNFDFTILSSTLRQLDTFKAAGCQINHVNDIISHLGTSLWHLDLSDNFIGNLNAIKFERLPELDTINLRNTSLSIGDSNPFGQLKRIYQIDVSHNDLSGLNFKILSPTLRRLWKFNAAFCQIQNVSSVVEHLTSVEQLNLSGNNLKEFGFGLVKQPERMTALNISDNHLKTFTISSRMEELHTLDLRGNKLRKITNVDRAHLPKLFSLDIFDNQLSLRILKRLENEWKDVIFIDNTWKRKHHIV